MKINKKGFLAVTNFSLFFLFISNSFATVKPKISYTTGANNYQSTTISVDIGNKLHFQPSYQSRSSNLSQGTSRTYSGRLALDEKNGGIAVNGGVSPENNGYKNQHIGSDGWINFPVLGTQESDSKNQVRMELGAGATLIQHSDKFQITQGTAGALGNSFRSLDRGRGGGGGGDDDDDIIGRQGGAVKINQTEFLASLGLNFFEFFSIDLDLTKSSYDKDLVEISARSTELEGINDTFSLFASYPEQTTKGRLTLLCIPLITPYISVSQIKFEVNEPNASSLIAGASFSKRPFRFDAAVERYDPGNGNKTEIFTTFSSSMLF